MAASIQIGEFILQEDGESIVISRQGGETMQMLPGETLDLFEQAIEAFWSMHF